MFNNKEFPDNIIIGKPIANLNTLGINDDVLNEWTVFEDGSERRLDRLLVKYEFFSSMGQLRKNRPDLVKELNELDFMELKIGRKRVCIVVGEF
jgi:hypothetical protein